jgi:hypothetical protein
MRRFPEITSPSSAMHSTIDVPKTGHWYRRDIRMISTPCEYCAQFGCIPYAPTAAVIVARIISSSGRTTRQTIIAASA